MNRVPRTSMHTMVAPALSLAVLAFGGVAEVGAQVTSKVVTANANIVAAKAYNTKTASIQPSVDVTAGATIYVYNETRCNIGYFRRADAFLTITGGGGSRCSLDSTLFAAARGYCITGSTLFAAATGDILFLLTSAGGVVDGTLVIKATLSNSCPTLALPSRVLVDVHNDGRVEFLRDLSLPLNTIRNDTYIASIPLTLSPTSTTVRILSLLGGGGDLGACPGMRIDAQFVPSGGTVTKRGAVCQSGVDLGVSHVVHQPASGPVSQKVHLLPMPLPTSTTVGVYAVGDREWQIPLGPTNCLLRNNATLLVFVPPNAPALTVDFPAGSTPLTFYVQFGFATRGAGGFDLLHTSDSFLAVLK